MWLGLGAVAAVATTYNVGGTYSTLDAALDQAVEDNAAGVLVPPAVFQYTGGIVFRSFEAVFIDVPFDVEIDLDYREVDFDRIDARSPVVIREAHLADDGEWAVRAIGTTVTLDTCFSGSTEIAVLADNADVLVLGGVYEGHDRAFVATGANLTLLPSAIGDRPYLTANETDGNGAAIDAVGGSVVVDATVSGNAAWSGGAISVSGGATLTVLPGSTISWNGADADGGAIWADGATVDIQGGEFEGNYAWGHGGAAYVRDPLGIATITDATVLYSTAEKGGAWYLDGAGVGSFSVTGGTVTSVYAWFAGGTAFVVGGTADFADVAVLDSSTVSYYAGFGGVVASESATVSWTRGSWEYVGAMTGAGIYASNGTTTLDGVTAAEPWSFVSGALAAADGGTLTVRNVTATPTAGSGSALYANGAITEITDVAITTFDSPFGFDGAIVLEDTPSATLSRLRLCDNYVGNGASSLTVRGGEATLRSSFVWNNKGPKGAVEVLDGGALTVEHTTFAGNEVRAVQVGSGSSLDLSRSIFALQDPSWVAVNDPAGAVVSASDNWLETGAVASRNGADLGQTVGPVGFQAFTTDPWLGLAANGLDCGSNLYLHWDAPTVDWTPAATPEQADVDGTAPDYGGYGGPAGWPLDGWDPDGDGDRADLDCDETDASQFPRNDPTLGDCRCDTDGDGYTDPTCPDRDAAAPADCDDGHADAFPGNTAEDIPDDGIDQDCVGGDVVTDPPGDTDDPGDTDPPGGPGTDGVTGPETGFVFGGGGCATAEGSGVGALAALALLRRRRR